MQFEVQQFSKSNADCRRFLNKIPGIHLDEYVFRKKFNLINCLYIPTNYEVKILPDHASLFPMIQFEFDKYDYFLALEETLEYKPNMIGQWLLDVWDREILAVERGQQALMEVEDITLHPAADLIRLRSDRNILCLWALHRRQCVRGAMYLLKEMYHPERFAIPAADTEEVMIKNWLTFACSIGYSSEWLKNETN